jgi:hypothetical protein
MEFALISVLTTVGGIIMYLLIGAAVKTPGKLLASKFASLGNMSGKSYSEIKSVVGAESSIARKTTEEGEVVTIRQWMATGYHIVLLFDSNDMFIGISSETSV